MRARCLRLHARAGPKKEVVASDKAPSAVGPYSQASLARAWLPVCGLSLPWCYRRSRATACSTCPAASASCPRCVLRSWRAGTLLLMQHVQTMKLAGDGVEEQAEQVMRNMEAILAAAGCSFDDVVKTTVLCAPCSCEPSVRADVASTQADRHQGLRCREPDLWSALPFEPAGALHVCRLSTAAGCKG